MLVCTHGIGGHNTYLELKLSESLDEGHAFNISDGTSELYDANLWDSPIIRHWDKRHSFNPLLEEK